MEQRRIKVKPTKKQFKALMLLMENNGVSFLGYGGAAGGGKTILAALWISMMCSKYSGVRYGVFRRYITDALDTTFTSFSKALGIIGLKEASTIVELMKTGNDFDYVVTNGGKEIKFWNGSEIWFRGLQDKPTDVHFTKIGGLELTGAFVDEANECPELGILTLKKRVGRHLNLEHNIPRKVLCTFNPDKAWVYRTFYLPYKNNQESADTKFIPALPIDNSYLSQEYIDELKNEKNEVLKQRYYYGNFDFDVTPGRLFEYTALLDLFNNPAYNGQRYISCDAARKGKDTAVIMVWDGFEVLEIVSMDKCSNSELEDKIKELAHKFKVGMHQTIVDENGVGGGIIDHLECIGFINNASPISPWGSKNSKYLKRNFEHLKTQCYFELAGLVNGNKIKINSDGIIKDKIIEELDVIVEIDLDKDGKTKLIKKEDVKEKIGRSPDYSDCLMFRCYFELLKDPDTEGEYNYKSPNDNPYGTDQIDEWERMQKEIDMEESIEIEIDGGLLDDDLDGDVL